jgi:6-phosphofructokinase 1
VREGYEGLVRGNNPVAEETAPAPRESARPEINVKIKQPEFIENLRFGDGALLRDGTGDFPGRRSLKGRYIVRVGWDDVRGWLGEVCNPLKPIALLAYRSLFGAREAP